MAGFDWNAFLANQDPGGFAPNANVQAPAAAASTGFAPIAGAQAPGQEGQNESVLNQIVQDERTRKSISDNPWDNNGLTAGNISNNINPLGDIIQGGKVLGSDAFTQVGVGGNYIANMSDPYLNTVMNTAGYGKLLSGLDAFTQPQGVAGNNFANFAQLDPNLSGQSGYSTETWKALASKFGVDMNDPLYQQKIKDAASNYVLLQGMGGTNPDDARQMNQTLYKKQADGTWAPVSDNSWSQAERGSWLEENPGFLAPFAVLGAGALAAAGGVGAGAAAGSSAGAGTGATAGLGAGITGTGGASGLAAYGAGSGAAAAIPGGFTLGAGTGGITGAAAGAGAGAAGSGLSGLFSGLMAPGGTSGLTGSLANAVGLGSQWGAIPAIGQGAIAGGAQGALTAGVSGGDVWKGLLMGALGGAVSPAVGGAVKGAGLSGMTGAATSGALTGAGMAAINGGNPLTGGLLGGLGGGVGAGTNALTGNQTLSQVASQLATTGVGTALQNSIRDEVFQGRSDIMSNVYAQAAQRGISQQQLETLLSSPQGRQLMQQFMQAQGKGTLQSLFG